MKRFVSILAVCMLIASGAIAVALDSRADIIVSTSAEEMSPYYLYAYSASSVLGISGKTATCSSSCYGPSVTKISATQYLEKSSSGKWNPVAIWGNSAVGSNLNMQHTKSGLAKGSYRLRTVFTVYSGSDYSKSETITKISGTKPVS